MKTTPIARFPILFCLLILSTLGYPACTSPPPQPQPLANNHASDTSQPDESVANAMDGVLVTIELDDILDLDEGDTAVPDALIFSVKVENLNYEADGDALGIHFVYETLSPSGEMTYMLKDPDDPDAGYVEDENGPIAYELVETSSKRAESWGSVRDTTRQFSIPTSGNILSMRYWAEIVIKGEEQEYMMIDTPYVTPNEVLQQGGLIENLEEE